MTRESRAAGSSSETVAARDSITQARRLLASLGWTYGLPAPHIDAAATVSITATRPLHEVATPPGSHDLYPTGPNRGHLRIVPPAADDEIGRSVAPIVWAHTQILLLDEHIRIDWPATLPPMPEAALLTRVWENAQQRRHLYKLRNALIQAAHGQHPIKAIAEAAGLSAPAIYRIYRDAVDGVALPEGDVLSHIRKTIDAMRRADNLRPSLIAAARREGVAAKTVAHFAGVSDRTVRTLANASDTSTE